MERAVQRGHEETSEDVSGGVASRTPGAAFFLGAAGLMPFVGGAATAVFVPEATVSSEPLLIAYGASILSFLGGIQWGLAVSRGSAARWGAYTFSIVPSLIAWLAVFFGGREALLVLAGSLMVWLAVERWALPHRALPPWYFPLRSALTAVAAISLFVTFVFA